MESWFDMWQGLEIYIFSKVFRMAFGLIQPTIYNTEVKNEWSCTLNSPYDFIACIRTTLL